MQVVQEVVQVGSNQGRYTGIQAQVNQQQQGGIGVANFQPMDLSGIAKTIETIDNHIVKVQDANRTVDYLTLTEQLKAVDQEQATFSSTLDKDGNFTLLDGTKQNYKDYLNSTYEKKVQLVGDFKSKWKANRFQNDEMGVRIRSMQETMPIDRLQSEKAVELNLSQIRFGNATNQLIVNTGIPLATRVQTWQEAFKKVPLTQEQASSVQQNAMTNFVKVTGTDFENFNKERINAIMERSHGNPDIQATELARFYESPEFLQKQKDLEDAFSLMQEFPPTAITGKTLKQGLTTQELERENAIIEQNNKQYQQNIDFMVKNTTGSIPLLTSVALSGNADMPALQSELKRINDLLKSPYVTQQHKMKLGESKKQLTDAIGMGKQIQAKGILGVNANNAKTAEVAVSVLGSQEKAQQQLLAQQQRLEEKQQRENQQSMGLVLGIEGLPTEQQRLQAVKIGVNLAEQGILPLTKQEVVDSLLRNPNNLYKSYQETVGRYGLPEDSSGANAWFKTVAEQYGISKDVSIESIRAVSDNMQEAVQYLDYIKKSSASNYSFQTMGTLEKNLISNTTTGYGGDQNAYLNSVRGIIPNGVLKQIAWGKTYQEQKSKVFDEKSKKITDEFQDAFNKNYKSLSSEMLSNRKRQVQQQQSVGVAYQQGYMLKVDPASFGSVNINTGKETNLNRQPLSVIAGLNVLNASQKKYGLKGLQVTSMYREIPTSEGTKHSQKKNVMAFDFITGNEFNLRQQDLKLYATIEGLQKLGRVAVTGKNDYMYKQLYQMQALKEYNLAGLTAKQNANLREWVKAMPLIKPEGKNADTHLHITVEGITPEKVKQYTPSYYAQKLQVGR